MFFSNYSLLVYNLVYIEHRLLGYVGTECLLYHFVSMFSLEIFECIF